MGWDYHHEIAPYERKKICRRHLATDRYEVVKDTVVGTTWYAAVRNKKTGKVSAVIVLTHIDRNSDCNFGMKWMDEECGPYRCDCPASILNLLTPTCDTYAQDWRERCRARLLEKKNSGSDALRTAAVGTVLEVTTKTGQVRRVVKMAPNRQFKTFWLLIEGDYHYLPKSRVKSARVA